MDLVRTNKFKRRFKEYYQTLCNIAYGYIPDRDECEDIVQDTFITVWNKEKDLLPEKEFLSYMVIAVKNNCISVIRKQRFDTVSMDDSENSPNIHHLADNDNHQTEELSAEEKLHKILSVLPARCKEIFLLSKLHGMKYREIAEELDISEKTVENQMGKALKTLREYIAGNPVLFILFLLITILLNNKLK
ncbi:MAG: RNA polymerase sigma-70 factor [Bacteroidales bacterium]